MRTGFGNTAASNAVTPAQVKSFASSQGGGSLVNAGQTGLVPASLNGTSLTPKGTALILEVLTETPLGLARLINAQAHRPFSSIVPMMWLFTRKVTPRLKLAIQDFVHACYLPAKARLIANSTTNPTFQDLLPWDGSPIVAAMRNHEVLRSHQLGIPAFGGAIPQELITCDTYAAQVQQDALAWLNTEQTESGTPLSDVYQNELQMDPLTVARYAIYREMLAAAGPEIPSPSLTGTFLALRGASVVGRIMGGALVTAM